MSVSFWQDCFSKEFHKIMKDYHRTGKRTTMGDDPNAFTEYVEGYTTGTSPTCQRGTPEIVEGELYAFTGNPAVELSLLIIDLQTTCVVKAEKGNIAQIGRLAPPVIKSNMCVFMHPFAKVRAAIDALAEGEKLSIPRIVPSYYENGSGDIEPNGVYLYTDNNNKCDHLSQVQYDALCRLAGVKIPIWTPKAGTWDLLNSLQSSGIKIWRYTRTEAK